MSKYCEVCQKQVAKYTAHIRTRRHIRLAGGEVVEEAEDLGEVEESKVEDLGEDLGEEMDVGNNIRFETDDFLSDLNNVNYKSALEEETPKIEVENKKEVPHFMRNIIHQKSLKRATKKQEDDDVSVLSEPELFSNKPTEILGKDRRSLLNKIRQYKHLFSAELKKFKIKKKPTLEELKAYLEEIDVIINTNSVDGFINESILQCIKIVEGVSAMTKNYNITGLSDLLKVNPQFQHLTKQLYLKYGSFANVPPENQLLFIVLTSAWVCKCKNVNRDKLDDYLNKPAENI